MYDIDIYIHLVQKKKNEFKISLNVFEKYRYFCVMHFL